MQDAPLHRLPVSSLIQFVNEAPRGDFGPVADFDDLGPALGGHRGIERRDVHPVDNSSDGPRRSAVATRVPKLVTRQELLGMMVCNRSPASPRCCAPRLT